VKATASPRRAPKQGEKMKMEVVGLTVPPRMWGPGVLCQPPVLLSLRWDGW